MTRCTIIWTTFAACVTLVAASAECSPEEKETRAKGLVSREATIHEGRAGGLEVHMDLGELPAGQTVPLSLILRNPSNQALPIRRMTTSCVCLKLKSLGDEIDARKSVELEAKLDVPRRASEIEQKLLLTIFTTEKHGVTVVLTYRIAGLVSFRGTSFITRAASTSPHTFRIPVLITNPASVDKVQIKPSAAFENASFQFLNERKSQFLECTISPQQLSSSLVGRIEIWQEDLGTRDSTSCIVEVRQDIEIAPSILRFHPSKEDSRTLKATAIIRLDPKLIYLESGSASNPRMPAKPRFNFAPVSGIGQLKTNVKRMNPEIYRVTLRWSIQDEDADVDQAINEGLHCFATLPNKKLRKEIGASQTSSGR